jgi:hypothetical protein
MSDNDSGAGVLGLKQRGSTLRRIREPAQEQPQPEPIISNHINSQLSSAVMEKTRLELNKLNPSNKTSKLQKIRNKFSRGIISETEQLTQDKRIEIEKGIFDILGVENPDKDAVKKPPKFMLIVIIVLLVLGGIIAVIILVAVPKINDKMAEIRSNWPEYRCKSPYSMFPSMFGPEGTTHDNNKAYCDAAAANSAFNSNIGGVQNQIDGQNNAIGNIMTSIENTQTMIFGIRDSLMQQINDIYQKMYSMFKRIAYLFKIFARLFYRIFQTFNSLFKTIKYAVWTLMSVFQLCQFRVLGYK